MHNIFTSMVNANTIQSIRTSENATISKAAIHTCARIAQLVFASGCFLATLQIPYIMFQILTGGFIFFLGPKMVYQAVPIILYYDLAKVSSNIASIFKSRVVLEFATNHLQTFPYGKQAAQILQDCEEGFSLPENETENINDAHTIASAVTYETIIAHKLTETIASFLECDGSSTDRPLRETGGSNSPRL